MEVELAERRRARDVSQRERLCVALADVAQRALDSRPIISGYRALPRRLGERDRVIEQLAPARRPVAGNHDTGFWKARRHRTHCRGPAATGSNAPARSMRIVPVGGLTEICVRRVPEIFRRSRANQTAAEQHACARDVDDQVVARVTRARIEDFQSCERGRFAGRERDHVRCNAEPAARRVLVRQRERVRSDSGAPRGAHAAHLVCVCVRDDQCPDARADFALNQTEQPLRVGIRPRRVDQHDAAGLPNNQALREHGAEAGDVGMRLMHPDAVRDALEPRRRQLRGIARAEQQSHARGDAERLESEPAIPHRFILAAHAACFQRSLPLCYRARMKPDLSPASAAQRPHQAVFRLADAQRRLTETLLRVSELPAAALARVDDALRAIDALEAALAPAAHDDAVPRLGAEPRDRRPYYVNRVMTPEHHPLRPELTISHANGVTSGRVCFGVTFEGPPGCVHGGFVSHFFDQILGQHNLWAGVPAMTASLSVRYRRGTPILRELAFQVTHELGVDAEGAARKLTTRGALSAEGVTYSEAEGLFVVPKVAAWMR